MSRDATEIVVAAAGDVVEEVAKLTVQKTRRIKTKPTVPQRREEVVKTTLPVELAMIQTDTTPVTTSVATAGGVATTTVGNVVDESTPAQASATIPPAASVEGQLFGAIVPPAH